MNSFTIMLRNTFNKTLPLFLITLVFFLYASSCKKDNPLSPNPPPPTLPPETQEGKNTFGCLVDGKVWLAEGKFPIPKLSCDYYNETIIIKANKIDVNPHQNILLNLGPIKKDTILFIKNYQDSNSFQNFYFASDVYYYPINQYTGQFNLKKLDAINRVMAGTFWFDAIDTASGRVVQIREGRFDVKY